MEREDFIRQMLPVVTRDLVALSYDDLEAGEIAKVFLENFIYLERLTPSPTSLELLVRKYAIRREDLKLLLTVAKAAAAGAGAPRGLFSSMDAALRVKVRALFAIFSTLRALHSNGRALDQEMVRILAILKERVPDPASQGLTSEELLQIFNLKPPTKDLEWMEHALQELRTIPLPGRSSKELVSELAGRWRGHV